MKKCTSIFIIFLLFLLLSNVVTAIDNRLRNSVAAVGIISVLSWNLLKSGRRTHTVPEAVVPSPSLSTAEPGVASSMPSSSSRPPLVFLKGPNPAGEVSTTLLSTVGTGQIGSYPSVTPLTTFFVASYDEEFKVVDYQKLVGWRVGNLLGDLPNSSYSTAVADKFNTHLVPNKTVNETFFLPSSPNTTWVTQPLVIIDPTLIESLLNSTKSIVGKQRGFLSSKWQSVALPSIPLGSGPEWVIKQCKMFLKVSLRIVVRCLLDLLDVLGVFTPLIVAIFGRYAWFFFKAVPSTFRRYAPVAAYGLHALFHKAIEILYGITVAWQDARRKHEFYKLQEENAIRAAKLKARKLEEELAMEESEKLTRQVRAAEQEAKKLEERLKRLPTGLPEPQPQPQPQPAPAPAPAPASSASSSVASSSTQRVPARSSFMTRYRRSVNRQCAPPTLSRRTSNSDDESTDEEVLEEFRQRSLYPRTSPTPVAAPARSTRQGRGRDPTPRTRGLFPTEEETAASVAASGAGAATAEGEDNVSPTEQTRSTDQQLQQEQQHEQPASLGLEEERQEEATANGEVDNDVVEEASAESTQPTMQLAELPSGQQETEGALTAQPEAVVVETVPAPEAMPLEGAQSGSPGPVTGAREVEEEEVVAVETQPASSSSETQEGPAAAAAPLAEMSEGSAAVESQTPAGAPVASEEDGRPSNNTPPSAQEGEDGGDNGGNADNERSANKGAEESVDDSKVDDGNDDDNDNDDNDDDAPAGSGGSIVVSEEVVVGAGIANSQDAEPLSNAALPTPQGDLTGVGQEVPSRAAGPQQPRGILRTGNGTGDAGGSSQRSSARPQRSVRFAREPAMFHFRGDSSPMEVPRASVAVDETTPTKPTQTPMALQAPVQQAPQPMLPESEAPQVPQWPVVAGGEHGQQRFAAPLFPRLAAQTPSPVRPTALEEAVRTALSGGQARGGARPVRQAVSRRLLHQRVAQRASPQHQPSLFAHLLQTPPPSAAPRVVFGTGVCTPTSVSSAAITTVADVDMEEGAAQEAPVAGNSDQQLLSTEMDVDGEIPPSEENMEVDSENDAYGEVQMTSAPDVQSPPGGLVGEDRVTEQQQQWQQDASAGLGWRDPAAAAADELQQLLLQSDGESESRSDTSDSSAEFEQLMGNVGIGADGQYLSDSEESDGDAVSDPESEGQYSHEEDRSDRSESPPPRLGLDELSEHDLAVMRRLWPDRMARIEAGAEGVFSSDEEEEDDEEEEEEDEEEEEEDWREDEGPGGGSAGGASGGASGGAGGEDASGSGDAADQPDTDRAGEQQGQPPSWAQVRAAIEGLPVTCWVEPSAARMTIIDGKIVIDPSWVASNPGFTMSTVGQAYLRGNDKFRESHGWELIQNAEARKAAWW
ncbi:hypothetical protein ABEF95_013800 [Exophiala dermatitidis]